MAINHGVYNVLPHRWDGQSHTLLQLTYGEKGAQFFRTLDRMDERRSKVRRSKVRRPFPLKPVLSFERERTLEASSAVTGSSHTSKRRTDERRETATLCSEGVSVSITFCVLTSVMRQTRNDKLCYVFNIENSSLFCCTFSIVPCLGSVDQR